MAVDAGIVILPLLQYCIFSIFGSFILEVRITKAPAASSVTLPAPFGSGGVDLANVSYHMDINEKIASRLSVNGSPDTESIYLYNDATNPMNLGQALADYMDRLAVLLAVKCW